MKNCGSKIILICGLAVFLTSLTRIYGQDKSEDINLNYILVKLTFTSRISKSNEQINEQLIKEIRERKVDFILTSEGEEFIKTAGGSDLLLKEIRANFTKRVEEKLKKKVRASLTENFVEKSEYEKFNEEAEALYKKYTDNFRGDASQRKIALEAAREFIKRYSDEKNIKEEFREQFKEDCNCKEIIDHLKKMIPRLEKSAPYID